MSHPISTQQMQMVVLLYAAQSCIPAQAPQVRIPDKKQKVNLNLSIFGAITQPRTSVDSVEIR